LPPILGRFFLPLKNPRQYAIFSTLKLYLNRILLSRLKTALKNDFKRSNALQTKIFRSNSFQTLKTPFKRPKSLSNQIFPLKSTSNRSQLEISLLTHAL